ncbi:MAG: Choline dehydrogenase [Alphaproteobacteria bacterium]|nr:Choline dehydrogenase [Alphaproteobacteria bacterium]
MANGQANYDYIVIGAGAAGSIVAGEAAAAGFAVLLLDMGLGTDPGERDVWDPTRWYEVLGNNGYEIGWRSTQQANLNHRIINLLQSRGLGGCQLHNAMVYVRGGRSTYDHWANALGCSGWDYQTLRSCFETVEATVGIIDGAGDDFTRSFFDAAGRLGLPFNPDYNSGGTEYGAVPFQFTIEDDAGSLRRTTSHEKYVRARAAARLTVEPGCFVHRIVPGASPSVEYRDRFGNVQTLVANRDVVLSAGAIGTPAILLRSGIGAADALRRAGVTPVHDLPGVGGNFYDDLGVGILVVPTRRLPIQPYGYIAAGAFASSSGTDPGPNPAYAAVDIEVQLSTNELAGAPPLPKPLPDMPYMIIGASALHLKSRGSVTIGSGDPYLPPIIDPNWLSDPADIDHCLAALALTIDIANDPGLVSEWGWTPPQNQANPLFPIFPVEVSAAWIKATGLTVQHYVGSCAMGTGAQAVVDPATMKVIGLDGIRVIDASAAPTPVTGNTAGVSMVVGARGAQLLLAS